jgi:hypothetical protein
VTRDRHQVGRRRRAAQVEPRGGLHRVGVQRNPRHLGLDRSHHPSDRVQVGDDPGLVVGQHDRDDRRGRAQLRQRRRQLVEVDATIATDRHDSTAERLDRVEHGVVLDRGAHGHPGPRGHAAADGVVVGLRAPRGEHDLSGRAPEHRGDALAGLVDGAHRVAGQAVRARRVAVTLAQER